MANSTLTLQSVLDFARIHSKLIPIVGVGGVSGEPGLSICNDVLTEVLAQPYPWKFNRKEAALLVTRQYVQDYVYSGATAFVLQNGTSAIAANSGGVAIDLAVNPIRGAVGITQVGTTATVNTIEAHPFQVGQTVYLTGTGAAYDSNYKVNTSGQVSGGYVITAVPSAYSFQFTTTAGLGTSGAPGCRDFGWLESASLLHVNTLSVPQPVETMSAVKMLDPTSQMGNPHKAAMVSDNGDGTLKIRFYPLPGTYTVGVNLVYQKKAPLLTKLTQTFSPIPDEMSYVLRQGVVAKAYRYVDAAKAEAEYQMFLNTIARALGQKDSEQDDHGFAPARPLMDWEY